MKFFDVHTHTQDAPYDSDREAVILRAIEAGIGMAQVGTDFDMSQKAVALAEQYGGNMFATVGLHPNDNKKEIFDYEAYKDLAFSSDRVVAMGECGLDYFRGADEAEKARQKKIFIEQIKLSKELNKPLMIHCREAFADLIEILEKNIVTTPLTPLLSKEGGEKEITSLFGGRSGTPGIVHFFSGSVDDARILLDMGFYFSFGGVLTFTRDYDEQVKFIPMDKILLETDAPYVAPVPHRGKRNESLYVTEVAKKIAEIKRTTFEEIARETTINAKKVFGV